MQVKNKYEETKKGWGKEVLIVNNKHYCGKLMVFDDRKSCSMHFHANKTETFYVLNGSFVITMIDTTVGKENEYILREKDSITIPRLVPHRITGTSKMSVLMEISTEHADDDSYRVAPGASQLVSML